MELEDLKSQIFGVQISVLPFTSCVTLGKLLNISEPPFSSLYDENDYVYLEELL